jgi:branched-chain amino acid transport system substrate-binding protein
MLRLLSVILMVTASIAAAGAREQQIRIGVLNDLSSVYADYQGIGSVIAAQMAVDDFGGKVGNIPVEVLSADHQNKADIGSAIAQRWFDLDRVNLIIDVPNSSVALAVSGIARDKNKVLIGSGAGSAALTGASCSPNTIHWTYDTWALANGVAQAVVGRGLKRWFFITSDYAFGHDLERQARGVVERGGGTVLGAARHPLGTSDFSSFLLQAQASGADVVGLATPGGDLSNMLKQAREFGLAEKQKLVGLIVAINNVEAIGLKEAQGLIAVNPFYWDLNDATRAWAKRFADRHPRKNFPNDMQAGVYAAVLHYLKIAAKLDGDVENGRAVVAAMKDMPTDDVLFGKGVIRPDGRKTHPMYVLETKTPQESKGRWDYFRITETIPADKAFRPLSEGGCSLVK